MDFKNSYTFKQRLEESTKVKKKYPDRIPIICEKNKKCRETPDIDKKKYLVPSDLTMGQFLNVIRQRMKFRDPSLALFLLVNGKIYSTSELISYVYDNDKDEDGFLYILYTSENTFG